TPTFIDGGSMIAPRGGFFARNNKWAVENEGVAPDVDVENWPKDVVAGRDPQLERAVVEAMRLLRTSRHSRNQRTAAANLGHAFNAVRETDLKGKWFIGPMKLSSLTKAKTIVVLSLCLVVFSGGATGQKTAAKKNPEIVKMVREVSAKNIEATIRKLVSFGTRNTLSSQDDPKRGIGAARDSIYGEFQLISNDCGGCLQVSKQSFV